MCVRYLLSARQSKLKRKAKVGVQCAWYILLLRNYVLALDSKKSVTLLRLGLGCE
jgi:hypothetical protein